MNTNEKITIDCTPTWSALLPVLLDIYAQHSAKVKNSYSLNTDKAKEAVKGKAEILAEFKNMALAADKWNEHCKAS